MSKKGRILGIALLIACLGALAWQVLSPREPVYEGRPLSAWLRDYDRLNSGETSDVTRPIKEKADEAVRHMGTNAIPTLIHMLLKRDSALKTKFVELANRLHFLGIHFDTEGNRSWRLKYGFDALGATAKCAIPALIQGLENEDWMIRCNSIWALVEIHAEPELAVPALVKALGDLDAKVRCDVVYALMDYGSNAKPAVPILVKMLNDKPMANAPNLVTNALKAIDPEAAAKAGIK